MSADAQRQADAGPADETFANADSVAILMGGQNQDVAYSKTQALHVSGLAVVEWWAANASAAWSGDCPGAAGGLAAGARCRSLPIRLLLTAAADLAARLRVPLHPDPLRRQGPAVRLLREQE